jgi:hypothetical protein
MPATFHDSLLDAEEVKKVEQAFQEASVSAEEE